MKTRDKGKLIGAIGALLVHALLIGFLVWMTILIPEPEEESGVPILMGEVDYAIGGEKVAHYVDVEVMPAEPKIEPAPQLPTEAQEEIITQVEEETVVIEPKKETKKKPKVEPKVEAKKPKEKSPEEKALDAKKKEQERIERQRKEAEEAKKREVERKEREIKEAEAAARLLVSGAFGKGAQMDGEDLSTQKVKDAFDGMPTTGVSVSGQSGYGTFDLRGRSVAGDGKLPLPAYNMAEEVKVVVNITVNPAGKVISVTPNPQTNTANTVLRKAAEEAARKAQFNRINRVDNQMGTITYYFNLK